MSATGMYVRYNNSEKFEPRVFGPKSNEHPTCGVPCIACGEPMEGGQYTTLIPLGPGGDVDAYQKAVDGRWYNAIAVEIHAECAGMKVHTMT